MKTWKTTMLLEDGTEAVEVVQAATEQEAEAEAVRRQGGWDKVGLPWTEEQAAKDEQARPGWEPAVDAEEREMNGYEQAMVELAERQAKAGERQAAAAERQAKALETLAEAVHADVLKRRFIAVDRRPG